MANSRLDLQMSIDGVRFKSAEKGLKALSNLIIVPFSDLGPIASEVMHEVLDGVLDAMDMRHGQTFSPGQARPSGPGRSRGNKKGRLQVRSGALLSALRKSKRVKERIGLEVIGTLSLGGVGAVHEKGAIIKARKAKYLTIPFDAALNADGTPIHKRARDWQDTFVIKSKKGNLLIVQEKNGRIIPLYLLKKSVRIPPRLGLQVTLDKAAPLYVDRMFERMVARINQQRPGSGPRARDTKGRFV